MSAGRPNPQTLWDDRSYRRRRKQLMATVTGQSRCWRCKKLLQDHPPHKDGTPARWTSGHVVDGDPRSPLALEASTCNFRAGGTVGARLVNRMREPRSPNA